MRPLSLIVTERSRVLAGLVLFPAAGALYLLTNRFQLSEPATLQLTWLDRACPLLPSTVWIYASELLYFPCAYLLCRNLRNINLFVYAFATLQLVSNAIFFFWPTTFPRDAFAVPVDTDSWSRVAFDTMRSTDTAANCCPSLHVSGVFMTGFLFLGEQRQKLPFFMVWATAIGVSTLTTKQHYVVDVVAGFALAVAIHLIVRRGFSSRDTSNTQTG